MHATSPKFQVHEAGPTTWVLTCQGGLSWEDRELLANHVAQYLQQCPTVTGLVIDLAGVEFVNSAGLGALFQLQQRLRARGGRMVFANVPPILLRVFRAVGLDRIAGVQPNVEAGLTWLTGQPCPDTTEGKPDQPAAFP